MNEKTQRWNNTYSAVLDYPAPNRELHRYRALLPKQGLALDVACGLGADALYLADQGFDVIAWDGSVIAIDRLQAEAKVRAIDLDAACLEITPKAFTAERFDLIYVHRYLDREIMPAMIQGLKPGGVLFYHTFLQGADTSASPAAGPTNNAYRLAPNELLTHCSALTIKLFIEGFAIDAATQGLQPAAMSLIIAAKPNPS